MHVSLIAAMAKDRVIGYQGDMPWHLPAELGYFKELTMGKPIIMGRKTFASIGRALPGRTNIVLTRQGADLPEGVIAVGTVEDALAQARAVTGDDGEVMIIGGGEIYKAFLPQATRLYLTHIDLETQGDTWFPDWNNEQWQRTLLRESAVTPNNPLAFKGYLYERK
ncbi:type 3 dihydrofolate reductase [Aliidiomarina indica]|uniref:type 3 dihydrofolate reductase n=1 Tax=Aliidiomarina indica TaxID=2749147 RepID=UPI0018901A36|nr:type 3 dihydrofolate reductase [Aliidiomarina indica]